MPYFSIMKFLRKLNEFLLKIMQKLKLYASLFGLALLSLSMVSDTDGMPRNTGVERKDEKKGEFLKSLKVEK